MEERGGSGDDDDADEGQECSELLLPGERFAGDQQSADVAGQDWGKESENGCFCEGHVEKCEVQTKHAKEAKYTASDEEREEIARSEGEMWNLSVIAICEGEDRGEGLTREEDLRQAC